MIWGWLGALEGGRGWGLKRGLGGVGGFQSVESYKQAKFLGKILQHCCGNSFSFLKWSGRESGGPRGDTG